MEQNREGFDIVQRIRSIRIPVALVQGTKDHAGLVQGSKRLIENNPSISWIRIEGGNHTFGAVHPFQGETAPLKQAVGETIAWLSQVMLDAN